MQCQRRTGSPFSVVTLFPKDQVRIEGPRKVFRRDCESGRTIDFQFCPNCGSTVYWRIGFAPGFVAIALGTFTDLSLPAPTVSVWEATKFPWVSFDIDLAHCETQVEPEGLA
jgi:hypothetical protein